MVLEVLKMVKQKRFGYPCDRDGNELHVGDRVQYVGSKRGSVRYDDILTVKENIIANIIITEEGVFNDGICKDGYMLFLGTDFVKIADTPNNDLEEYDVDFF